MTRKILVLNGPNLNLLGTREPDVYGSETLDDIIADLREYSAARDADVTHLQSNSESDLIDALHAARNSVDGVVFNAGAFTHYSIALRDAIAALGLPVIETHLSNVHARESFRHTSVLAPVCLGVVAGLGRDSYFAAIEGLLRYLTRQEDRP
ncbi:MAG: type II 3-dehydroquinate dehydratase [Acidimicrobiia bacterium]